MRGQQKPVLKCRGRVLSQPPVGEGLQYLISALLERGVRVVDNLASSEDCAFLDYLQSNFMKFIKPYTEKLATPTQKMNKIRFAAIFDNFHAVLLIFSDFCA